MKMASQAIARFPVISALGLICAAQFVLQLDFGIVNVTLPASSVNWASLPPTCSGW